MAKHHQLLDSLKLTAGLVILAVINTSMSDAAYLPELGPGDLRFQKEQAARSSYKLPPLDMGMTAAVSRPSASTDTNDVSQPASSITTDKNNTTPTNNIVALSNPTNAVVLEARSGSSDIPDINPDQPLPQSAETPNDVMINPQVVVPLLQPMHDNGRSHGNPAVVVPAFLPPPPPTPSRSSTATYTVE